MQNDYQPIRERVISSKYFIKVFERVASRLCGDIVRDNLFINTKLSEVYEIVGSLRSHDGYTEDNVD